jgi:hypothetical protein
MPNGEMPRFYVGHTFPPGIVAGHDFWITYHYAKLLRQGGDINRLPANLPENLKNYFSGPRGVLVYPPFVFALYAPYTFLSYETAYWIQSGLLFLANLGVVGMVCLLLLRQKPITALGVGPFMLFALFSAVSFVTVSGYGYLFSLERGNSDAFAIFLVTACLYGVICRPGKIWGSALLLSLAIHIKVTPVVFCLIFFWRYRLKCLLPLLLINVALLVVWGPGNAVLFVKGISQFGANPDGWWGDHSVHSFATTVLPSMGGDPMLLKKVIVGFVLAMWGSSVVVLWRRSFTGMNALLMYCISVPLMMLLPSSSNDYKLVMLGGAMAVMVGGLYAHFVASANWLALSGMSLLMGLFMLLSTSGGLFQSPWLINKCPLIVLFMMAVTWVVMRPFGVFDSRENR